MTDVRRAMLESLIAGNKSHIKTLELQIEDFQRCLDGKTTEVWCDPDANKETALERFIARGPLGLLRRLK